MSRDIKQFLKNELKRDAKETMESINQDPALQELKAPDEIESRLIKQIREYEKQRKKEAEDNIAEFESRKRYVRRPAFSKVAVLVAVLVLAMACGMTAMGGPKRLVEILERTMMGRSQVGVEFDDDQIDPIELDEEEEAYQKIADLWNVEVVRMIYLPDGVEFREVMIEETMQYARFYYERAGKKIISYRVMPSNRATSHMTDIEEPVIKEYQKNMQGIIVSIKQHQVKENEQERWTIEFEHQDTQYFIWIIDENEEEVEKIVENLYF